MSTTQTREAWLASLKAGDQVALEGMYHPTQRYHDYSLDTVRSVTPSGRIKLVSGKEYNPDGSLRGRETGRAMWGSPSYKLVEPTPNILESIETRTRRRELLAEIKCIEWDKLSNEQLDAVLAVVKKHAKGE